jgi:hypothetical protein
MKKEENTNLDNYIPDGWEFREEYMEEALVGLKKHRKWARWNKFSKWFAAAIGITLVAASLLHVCSNPSGDHLNPPIAQTDIQQESAKSTKVINPIVSSDTSKQQAQNNSINQDNQAIPKLPASQAAQSTPQTPVVAQNKSTSGHSTSPIAPSNSVKSSFDNVKVKVSDFNQLIEQLPNDRTNQTATNQPQTKIAVQSLINDNPNADVLNPSFEQKPNPLSPTAASPVVDSPAALLHIAYKDGRLQAPTQILSNNTRTWGKPLAHRWNAFVGNTMWANFGKINNEIDFQPCLGLEYQYRMSRKWSAYAQLGYQSIQDPGAVLEQTQIIYDYSQLQKTTKIYTERLHYTTLHGGISRRFNPFWSASAGFTSSIKISGTNTIHRYDMLQHLIITDEQGYVSGFKRFNHGVHVQLDRAISRRLGLRLQYIHGFTDVSIDRIFGQVSKQTNSHFNLLLTYRIQ